MIVSDRFNCDDMALPWAQHDVHGDALGIILGGCRSHFVNACRIVADEAALDRWHPDKSNVDHRTMQDAHDLLAAAWRFRVRPPQPSLLELESDPSEMGAWLQWLRTEVAGWNAHPDLVRLVLTIVTDQNADAGYAAEDELTSLLRARFCVVPWKARAE